jgi:hypothetical protein
MRLLTPLAWIAVALAAAHVLVGIGVAFVGNEEGSVGGVFYVLVYALPLLLIAGALRSSRRSWHTAAGWAALLLAVFYSLVVVGNWSGYSTSTATFAISITAPTAALDLVVVWACFTTPGGLWPSNSRSVTLSRGSPRSE